MNYRPGKHLIATLKSGREDILIKFLPFRNNIDELIQKYQLCKLGEVYHNFSPGGFTAVVCLSESHISIHTWPEHKLINIDIYLSNFQRDNGDAVLGIFNSIESFFEAVVIQKQIIER